MKTKTYTLSNGIELVCTMHEDGFESNANKEFALTQDLIAEKHQAHLDFAVNVVECGQEEKTALIVNIIHQSAQESVQIEMAEMFANIGEELGCAECDDETCESHPNHAQVN